MGMSVHSSDPTSTRQLASIDHDEKLHEMVIDGRTARLNNKNVFVADRYTNFHGCFHVGESF
jgi:hypothetical protein